MLPTMVDAAICARINQAIADEFELELADMTPDQRLIEDLGLDSLDSVDLIATLERTFKVKCPEAQARQLRTLGEIHAFVEHLLPKAA
jgi:acyl carrier protein